MTKDDIAIPAIDGRPRDGYLPTLDGWRAIAILMVMACHAGIFYFSTLGPHPSELLKRIASGGGFGVDIFFAISGFLICTRLLREQQSTGRIDLRSFYIRRAFRILPPYLLYLLVITLLAAGGWIIVEKSELLSCLFFVRNYLPFGRTREIGWYTGQFWSLSIEEHFYLLWPAVLLLLRRTKAARWAVAIIALVTIWRTVDTQLSALLDMNRVFEHRTDTRIDSLLWGCLFAMFFTSLDGYRRMAQWMNPFCVLAMVAALFESIAHLNALTAAVRPILFAAIVTATVVRPRRLISRILENSCLRWIGRISFSLYIWQEFFLPSQYLPRPLPFGRWQELPLSIVAIFICAMSSHYFIEQPMIRLGRRWSHRRSLLHASSSMESSSSIGVIAAGASDLSSA